MIRLKIHISLKLLCLLTTVFAFGAFALGMRKRQIEADKAAIQQLRAAGFNVETSTEKFTIDILILCPEGGMIAHRLTGANQRLHNLTIKNIGRQRNLEELILTNCTIDDEVGLRFISNNEKLSILNLSKTNIGDKSMAYISNLPSLEHVDISHTNVTPEGVLYLTRCKTLRSISLGMDQLPKTEKKLELLAHVRTLQIHDSILLNYAQITMLQHTLPGRLPMWQDLARAAALQESDSRDLLECKNNSVSKDQHNELRLLPPR